MRSAEAGRARQQENETGAALLAVLLMVAVTGAIAAAALESLSLSRAVAANTSAIERARGFAGGAEALALLVIDDATTESPDRTTNAGGWNGAVRRIPLPGDQGTATLRVSDGGNCFNVNSVVEGDPPGLLARRASGVRELASLIQLAGGPAAEAQRIAEAAADWADSDAIPGPGGAEDEFYQSRPRPYRAANALFADVGELGQVAGMTPALMARLRPWLCALPVTDLSPININTLMPDQAPLLAMLAPDQLDAARARRILESRPTNGWGSQVEFWRIDALRDLRIPLDIQLQLRLKTDWYRVETRVALDDSEYRETLLVDARLQPARIALRRLE